MNLWNIWLFPPKPSFHRPAETYCSSIDLLANWDARCPFMCSLLWDIKKTGETTQFRQCYCYDFIICIWVCLCIHCSIIHRSTHMRIEWEWNNVWCWAKNSILNNCMLEYMQKCVVPWMRLIWKWSPMIHL